MRILMFLLTASLLATNTPVMAAAPSPRTSLPTLAQATSWVTNAWHEVVTMWQNVLHKLGWRQVPPIVTQLYATRVTREDRFTKHYQDTGIPPDLARIAGVLDRMEDDFSTLKKELATTTNEHAATSLRREIQDIDDNVDRYMDSVQEVIDAHEHAAFTKKKSALFQFIQVLQSRSFLTQLLEN